MSRFNLVDFAAHFQKGFRNHIVPVGEIPKLVEAFRCYGCYATYFFYSDEILAYMSTRSPGSAPTVSGYEGKVWASRFFIDLDHPELLLALDAARFLFDFFTEHWRIDPAGIQVYFSGSKGFHLMIDTRLFGRMTPSRSLPHLFAAMRSNIALEMPDPYRDTMDLGIKDRVRLLRLPNTIHEKSKLYKTILLPEELKKMTPKEVRKLAKQPRPLPLTDETGLLSRTLVKVNPQASAFFRRVRRQVRRVTRRPFQYRFRRPEDLRHLSFPCAGLQKIWESHIEPGYRNNCAIRLASELRLFGLMEDEVRQKLFDWNEQNSIDLPSQEVQSVVRSAFHPRFPYRYSCWDEILRHFCPLPDIQACQDHLESCSQ